MFIAIKGVKPEHHIPRLPCTPADTILSVKKTIVDYLQEHQVINTNNNNANDINNNITPEQLRLIFHGRLLKNEDTLSQGRITDGVTVHMVISSTTTTATNNNTNTNQTSQQRPSFLQFQNVRSFLSAIAPRNRTANATTNNNNTTATAPTTTTATTAAPVTAAITTSVPEHTVTTTNNENINTTTNDNNPNILHVYLECSQSEVEVLPQQPFTAQHGIPSSNINVTQVQETTMNTINTVLATFPNRNVTIHFVRPRSRPNDLPTPPTRSPRSILRPSQHSSLPL